MIIAVDGPAASGKGTIAKSLARHYGLPHLDTGLLYRAVAASVVDRGGDPQNAADALSACAFDDALLSEPRLRDDAVGSLASVVSAHPAVRAALLERQRRFAAQDGGAVLDGRDIGTVIAPGADAKLFVTASLPERARRRHAEQPGSDYDAILGDLRARDARDMARDAAPLHQAPEATLIDTSALPIVAAVAAAIAAVDAQTARNVQDRPATA